MAASKSILLPSPLPDPRLARSERAVARALNELHARKLRAGKAYPGLTPSPATIARLCDYSVRTVQAAIKRLIELGYLRRVRDWALRTCRRLFPLWLEPEPDATPLLPEPEPVDAPPPAEPIGPGPAAAAIPADPDPEPEPTPAPPPAVAPELLAKAAAAMPDDRPAAAAATIARFARDFDPAWIGRALGLAAARRASKGPVGWGWVRRLLENWRAEGGPPPEAPAGPGAETPEERAARIARINARLFGPKAGEVPVG